MRYAGLENGHECWCGADGAQYDQYGRRDDAECSSACYGNSNQTCGSDFRISVYDCKLRCSFLITMFQKETQQTDQPDHRRSCTVTYKWKDYYSYFERVNKFVPQKMIATNNWENIFRNLEHVACR